MRPLRAWFLRLAGLLNKQRRERELAEELESHLQLHIDDNLRSGMTPVEARRQALIKLGGIEQTKEIYRDRRGFPLVESLIQDVRYGLRMLAKSPGFTAVVVGTLALGIGGTTAIFSLIYGGVLNPLPYADSQHLVALTSRDTRVGSSEWYARISRPEVLDYRKESQVFDEVLGGAVTEDLLLTGVDAPQFFNGAWVTDNTFRVLGVSPVMGRTIMAEDCKPGAPPVVVLSHKVWLSKFGGEAGIVGRRLVLNHEPATVIGVMPPRFRWLEGDLWLPAILSGGRADKPAQAFWVVGHLKAHMTMERAAAEVTVLAKAHALAYPNDHPPGVIFGVASCTALAGHFARRSFEIFFVAAGLLLLIACANVANLLMVRGTGRAREIAVRTALGAGRLRLVRQLIVENSLYALAGGVLGCLLGGSGLSVLVAVMPWYTLPQEAVIRIDPVVLCFTFGVVLASTLLFGLAPAVVAARKNLGGPLKASSRGAGENRTQGTLRNLLVVGEVGLSMVLMTGACLLTQDFFGFYRVDLGYDPDHLFEAYIRLPEGRYKTVEQRNQFYSEVLRRVRGLPGIISAAQDLDGIPGGWGATVQNPNRPSDANVEASVHYTSDSFLQTLRIRLLRGRDIAEEDIAQGRKIALVNRKLADKYFAFEDTVGRQIKVNDPSAGTTMAGAPTFEIVGVVSDTRDVGPGIPPEPQVYVPFTAVPSIPQTLFVRSPEKPESLLKMLRGVINELDKDLPIDGAPLRDELFKYCFISTRYMMTVLSLFAALGLALIGIGVYSVLSYSVSCRTHEFGVRMALGANPADVYWAVLKSGLRWLASGIAIGIPTSIALGRAFQSWVYALTAVNPLALSAVSVVLTAVGLAACYIPARRATKVDPMVALRFE